MAADDVVGQAIGPLLGIVVIAVGEDVVPRGQRDRERVSLAGRDDLEPRAVRPDPDHPAAGHRGRRAVLADGVGQPLVADRDVEIAVDPEPDTRGDMVVDPIESRDFRTEAGDQIHPLVGTSVPISISKRREKRGVDDEEGAVDPLQAHDAPELVGEDVDLAALDRHDRVGRPRRRPGHVHRVLAEVDRPVGGDDDGRREEDVGGPGDRRDRPSLGHLRHRAVVGSGDGGAQEQRGEGEDSARVQGSVPPVAGAKAVDRGPDGLESGGLLGENLADRPKSSNAATDTSQPEPDP